MILALVVLLGVAAYGRDIVVSATNIDCPKNTSLVFEGSLPRDSTQRLQNAQLALDNRVVAQADGPTYKLAYRTSECGLYSLRLRGSLSGGQRVVVQKGWLNVNEDKDCSLRFSSVAVQGIDTLQLKPVGTPAAQQIKVYITQGTETSGPFTAENNGGVFSIGLASVDLGDMTVYAEAVADDCHYVSPSYRVKKLRPIELLAEKTGLLVDGPDSLVKMNVRLQGIEKTTLKLMADDELIGTTEVAQGDNKINLDAIAAPTKSYTFCAIVDGPRGELRSPEVKIDLRNPKEDSRGLNTSLYQGKIEGTRLMKETLEARHKILATAADILALRIGKLNGARGAIRGLCVLSGPQLEIGDTMSIKLEVTPKSDHKMELVWGNKAVDLDAQISMLNALHYAESYIQRSIPSFSINDYKYVVTAGDGGAIGGDSGGAALATLLISYFTDVPIRSDVALTGTVDAQGVIGEVGGYAEKSFAAFTDPNVTTLIIPRTKQAIYESMQIGALVATHRVVGASTMEQVLRNALVTDATSRSICEGQWLEALRLYKEQQSTVAVSRLQAMQVSIPEDLTCELWCYWLLDENKFTGEIAANERWIEDFKARNPEVENPPDPNRPLFRVVSK